MSDRDPLPDELAGLFAAERSAPAGDSQTRAEVRSRLAAVVTLLPTKAAAATSTAATTATILSGTGKIIAIVAISLGVGLTAVTVTKSSESPSAVSPAIPVGPTEQIDVSGAQQVVQSDEGSRQLTPPEQQPVLAETAEATAAKPSEAKLLKRAWAALSSGDAKQTLELTREAERLHPDGALVEEREALRIQAFVKLGLLAEARTAAEQFVVRFPESVHRTRVESAIKAEESP